MFTVTALGHQGWLIGTPDTHVLIDPVLTPRFTRMPTSGAAVYPPRALDLRGFPPIDAVLVTHEHPDHLDFASLQLLDPRTPVYLSAHTSDAARRVVASLGLTVGTLAPGVAAFVGDFCVLPFAPPRVGDAGSNEIDVAPLLVRDRGGHGSFFTSVDLPARAEWAREVRRHLDRPGVWADANSGYDRSLHFAWVTRERDPVGATARQLAERYVSLFAGWGHPEMVMVTDNGLSLGGDMAPLNEHVFEVPNDALIAAITGLLPGHRFAAALPGTTAELVDGALVATRPTQPFLAPEDRARWPARGGAPLGPGEQRDFSPGTGRHTLRDGEPARLERALGELGRFLFGRGTFCGLYQLAAGRDHGVDVLPTVALALRDGPDGARQVWEYVPQRSTFVRVACDDPTARYVAGAEFWASDLLAVLTFAHAADDLFHFGRKRVWNSAPAVFRCDLDTEVELFAHALRCPDEVEPLYRRGLAPDARPVLRGPAAAPCAPWASHPGRAPVVRPVPAELSRAASSASASALPATPSEIAPVVADHARLAVAVATATAGAWTLASTSEIGSGALRLAITSRDESNPTLEIAPVGRTARYYRRVGDMAFSYTPGGLTPGQLVILDRVILALARVLRAPAADAPAARR